MPHIRISLVRREVEDLLQKRQFIAAVDSVDSNLSKGSGSGETERAARRELLINIHRDAVKSGAAEDGRIIRLRFGDELSGPLSDFLEKIDPNDPSIIRL